MSFEVAHVDPRRPGAACAPDPALRNVLDRCRVVSRSAVPAATSRLRTATALANADGVRRHSLRAAHGLRVAAPSTGLPALGDDAALVSPLGAHGHLRAHRSCSCYGRPGTDGPGGLAHGRRGGCAGRPLGRCRRRRCAGYGAAKRVVGRKRHALVDTDGRLLLASISPASLHDSHGGIALLSMSRRPWPFLALCFADRAYAGTRVATATPVAVQLVGRAPNAQGFAVQPARWVIERTFGWTGRCRRLARDHEATVSSAVAFFTLAAATVLLRRIARAL